MLTDMLLIGGWIFWAVLGVVALIECALLSIDDDGPLGLAIAIAIIAFLAVTKEPAVRHDWTPQRLRWVQRWVNRRIWRKTKFEDYNPSIKTNRLAA